MVNQKESRVKTMLVRVYKKQHFSPPFIGLLIVIAVVLVGCGDQTSSSGSTSTTSTSTVGPTPTPQVVHYPPTTQADLRGLAATGDASAIHEFHSESVGAVGVCPQPKREETVEPSVTGQQLAENLLAYFYAQQLDSPCGPVVFACHNQAEQVLVFNRRRI